jgi:hypothetical protein
MSIRTKPVLLLMLVFSSAAFVYSKIQHTKDLDRGDVTAQKIQETQRLWLPYREAWVVFGQKKYPAVSADSWRAWLTRQRTDMLNESPLR